MTPDPAVIAASLNVVAAGIVRSLDKYGPAYVEERSAAPIALDGLIERSWKFSNVTARHAYDLTPLGRAVAVAIMERDA